MTSNLSEVVNRAVQTTLAKFAPAKLQPDQLAVTLVDLRATDRPAQASWRGDVLIYPASVVKLFYLVAAHHWLETGKLADTAELRRALRDMIVDSYNEATSYVVDLLTDTTSGPELPLPELARWQERRNAVNRYFASLGSAQINVNKKPWHEGPYGRETQSRRVFEPSRNWLTTNATARLMTDIVCGRAVSPERSRQMMELLQRDPFGTSTKPDDQARGFTGLAATPGMKLWSKAGWTSENRHDCAYLELPDGGKFVLVTFTSGHAKEREIIPTVAREVIRLTSNSSGSTAANRGE